MIYHHHISSSPSLSYIIIFKIIFITIVIFIIIDKQTYLYTYHISLHIYLYMYTGRWFGTCLLFSIQLGMSSSQLTNSYFFRGVGQPPTRYTQHISSHRPSSEATVPEQSFLQEPGEWVKAPESRRAIAHVVITLEDFTKQHGGTVTRGERGKVAWSQLENRSIYLSI